MNIQYQNELESSIYYANKKIDELKNKLKLIKQDIKNIIEKE